MRSPKSRVIVPLAVALAVMTAWAATDRETSESTKTTGTAKALPLAVGGEPSTTLFRGVGELEREILAKVAGRFTSVGKTADGKVSVGVLAKRALADELLAEYGDRVELSLGVLPYPDIDGTDGRPVPPCGDIPTGGPQRSLLTWTSEPARFAAEPGGRFEGTVAFTNSGTVDLSYESGDVTAGLVTRVGDRRIVARNDVEIAGVGKGGVLKPGERASVRVTSSSASCEPELGWTLPPGNYDVYVSFGGFAGDPARFVADQYVSTPLPLTVGK